MIKGIGVDIVEIERLKKNQEKIALKILTPNELELYKQHSGVRSMEWLAGRFALKEAIYKALHNSSLTISMIEVMSDEQGAPVCKIDGYKVHCSISHEKAYAIAYACIEVEPY